MNPIPTAIEEEKTLLGTLIHDFENASEFLDINAHYFYDSKHKTIFEAINEILINGDVNQQSVIQHLIDNGKLDSVGGTFFITGLFENCLLSQFSQAQDRVIETYKRRKYRELALKVSSEAIKTDSQNIEALIFNTIENMENNNSNGYLEVNNSIDLLLNDMMKRFEEGTPHGISTGFSYLDNLISGFEAGDLIIIGASTSHGKTALGLNIGVNISKQGVPVAIVSLEMPTNQLNQRIICREAKLNTQKTKNNELSDKEMNRFYKTAETIKKYPIYIDESRDNSISKIITRTKLLIKMKGIKLLIIDYLQLIKTGGNAENRNLELSEITMALKRFALKENITVLALAQLNRKASGKEPVISELRDSGALEQDADKVILLWRPEQDNIQGKEDLSGVGLLNVAKNRNGSTGKIRLSFNAESISFGNYSNYSDYGDFNG